MSELALFDHMLGFPGFRRQENNNNNNALTVPAMHCDFIENDKDFVLNAGKDIYIPIALLSKKIDSHYICVHRYAWIQKG